MKVFTVMLITFLGHASAVHNIEKRGSDDYAVSTAKPITGPEAPTSAGGSAISPGKYQIPSYLIPQKSQYSPPQQVNYLAQPAYKYSPQPAPVPVSSPVSYVPQQPQQQPQYTPRNVVYNTQPVARIPTVPQKIAYSPIPAHAPAPTQYSLAGDVSSFKYTSPFVSYSNLGVLQQSTGKASIPSAAQQDNSVRSHYSQSQQEAPVRSHYSQHLPQQPTNSEPLPRPVTYTQPQQLVYRPKLQLPQISYNSAPQQPATAPAPKLVYSHVPQAAGNVQRTQPVYPVPTQKIAASVPQQLLYSLPQQISYTPGQGAHGQQPAEPAHSIPQPVYVVAPQYQYYQNSDLGQRS